MKASDWALVIVVAAISVALSFWLIGLVLDDPEQASVTYDQPEQISSDLQEPDPEVFNVNAINPTVEVYVGQ